MSFASLVFLYFFLPIVLVGYYVLPRRWRNPFLLAANLVFYGWGEPWFLPVILLTACGNWLIGLKIERSAAKRRRLWLAAALLLDLGLLIAFKYQQRTGLRRPMAALLAEAYAGRYAGLEFAAVLPVPLHPARLRQRGYNQAELLSVLLAHELELPHYPQWLRREEDTPPLAELNRRDRLHALRRVFAAAPEVRGQRILLIDDIFTTGATAESCSQALLRGGAAEVYVLAVAAGRALP